MIFRKLQKEEMVFQGFEEANKLFGGNFTQISYKTQERTSFVDERINAIKRIRIKFLTSFI